MRLQNTLLILLQKTDQVRKCVSGIAREDRTWPLVYNSHRLIEPCGRNLKGFTRRVRDLDRALFRVIFGLKWAPLTAVMRAFTVAGAAGALWGFLAALCDGGRWRPPPLHPLPAVRSRVGAGWVHRRSFPCLSRRPLPLRRLCR